MISAIQKKTRNQEIPGSGVVRKGLDFAFGDGDKGFLQVVHEYDGEDVQCDSNKEIKPGNDHQDDEDGDPHRHGFAKQGCLDVVLLDVGVQLLGQVLDGHEYPVEVEQRDGQLPKSLPGLQSAAVLRDCFPPLVDEEEEDEREPEELIPPGQVIQVPGFLGFQQRFGVGDNSCRIRWYGHATHQLGEFGLREGFPLGHAFLPDQGVGVDGVAGEQLAEFSFIDRTYGLIINGVVPHDSSSYFLYNHLLLYIRNINVIDNYPTDYIVREFQEVLMNQEELARVFERIADLLEIKGELIFKVRAYRNAADGLRESLDDLEQLRKENRLTDIPGVGEAIAKKIDELLTTGKLGFLEKLEAEVPPSLLEVLAVPGIGPRKTALFWKQAGVTDLRSLEQAAREGKLRELPGVGEKVEQNILSHLAKIKS